MIQIEIWTMCYTEHVLSCNIKVLHNLSALNISNQLYSITLSYRSFIFENLRKPKIVNFHRFSKYLS